MDQCVHLKYIQCNFEQCQRKACPYYPPPFVTHTDAHFVSKYLHSGDPEDLCTVFSSACKDWAIALRKAYLEYEEVTGKTVRFGRISDAFRRL